VTDNNHTAFREGIEARTRMIDALSRFEAALVDLKDAFDEFDERHPKEGDDGPASR
jgi:hypothetical protein